MKMYLSIEGVSNFSLLLLLFIFVFALLGMQLFCSLAYQDLDGNAVPVSELNQRRETEILIPLRTSFDNIWQAMNSIYVIIMGDGWNWVMYENVLPFGTGWRNYAIFFVFISVFGNKVMLSLFCAILLENFEAKNDESENEESSEEEE